MKQLIIIALILALNFVPALAQDDECEGVRCDSPATGPLCEAVVLPILIVAFVWWLRR
jgi:hypothetical protein